MCETRVVSSDQLVNLVLLIKTIARTHVRRYDKTYFYVILST